ncbi:MAG TPA: hypothetical protein PKK23_19565 [Nitrospirales bacterium]|nr:hypothetical protein [Nitrospirales bacterium]
MIDFLRGKITGEREPETVTTIQSKSTSLTIERGPMAVYGTVGPVLLSHVYLPCRRHVRVQYQLQAVRWNEA